MTRPTLTPWHSLLSLSLLSLSLSLSLPSTSADPSPSSSSLATTTHRRGSTVPGVLFAGDYVCRLQGDCQPCPTSDLTTPVCKLYGNRRSLSCIPRKNGKEVEASFSSSSSSSSSPPLDPDAPSSHKASPGDKFYHAPLGGVGAGGRDSDDDAFDLSSNPPATRPGDGESAEAEAEYGQDRVKEEDEPGRLRGDFEAEEEMKLAVEEVEKELAGAGAGAGRGGVMIPDERRRRRWIVDEEEYERVLTERKTELGSRSVGTWRRQSGVQLKVQAWEACPKVLKAEKADFFEYILCNLSFAVLSLSVLVYRQRVLALRQFGKLAARIMQTEAVVG